MRVLGNKVAGLKVCKNHFREADFSGKHLNRQRFKSERRNLKKTAVPRYSSSQLETLFSEEQPPPVSGLATNSFLSRFYLFF